MPELPDLTVYVRALQRTIRDRSIQKIVVSSPFLVRTVEPPLDMAIGKSVVGVRRIGKRVAWELEEKLFLVFHLMIAGRFHWKKPRFTTRPKIDLAAFHFEQGVMLLTEPGPKKRASLHVVQGEESLAALSPGGLEVLGCGRDAFARALRSENHTLKRALTDPRLFSGIGNAYSDEILHAARLSPVKWTSRLTDDEVSRLHTAVQSTLETWIGRLMEQTGESFPEKVTAFREEMAVHGKYGKPCPVCGTAVQRIVFAENETNYCARCQTGGKLLADRSLSRLLRDDWPRSID